MHTDPNYVMFLQAIAILVISIIPVSIIYGVMNEIKKEKEEKEGKKEMQVLKDILNSEKTNLGKLDLVKQLEDAIIELNNLCKVISQYQPGFIQEIKNIHILGLILDEIKTKPTWGINQLKDLFLEKILDNL